MISCGLSSSSWKSSNSIRSLPRVHSLAIIEVVAGEPAKLACEASLSTSMALAGLTFRTFNWSCTRAVTCWNLAGGGGAEVPALAATLAYLSAARLCLTPARCSKSCIWLVRLRLLRQPVTAWEITKALSMASTDSWAGSVLFLFWVNTNYWLLIRLEIWN